MECAPELPSDLKKPQEKQQDMSVKEQAKAAVLLMQQNGSEALKGIFAKATADSADKIEENGDENLSEELEVVSRLFSENVELKSYYEKNFEGGDFICLVCCSATDKKMIKRFKHCYGIVQHCTKVPKMKKRAHKAFARFLCELLGWDFDSLPRRVVKDGAPLVESNANQNSEMPSSVIEVRKYTKRTRTLSYPFISQLNCISFQDHMCEDKADNPQDNSETCVG